MLDAFKIKPFDLEPVLTEWTDGPIFKGNSKKDRPVEEWLEKIKEGCTERKIPEEYWYKVAQHFMGRKAKARFEEVKQVVSKVNGGKYRWTWKKFKVAMTNMGWEIDANDVVKVQAKGPASWFMRKKSEEEPLTEEPEVVSSNKSKGSKGIEAKDSKRATPSRSNTMSWRLSKKVSEEPEGISTPGARPVPTRSKTVMESSFWPARRETKDESSADKDSKPLPNRPTHQKAKSETSVGKRRGSDAAHDVTTVKEAPAWLMNACTALDYITSEHPKAMSVVSAILITVGSIPAIPAISAGAGGVILASGAAHAIGAIAVGLGQALGASAMKNNGQGQQEQAGH